MEKTNMKVAVTLYNFRDYCQTEDDLARTLVDAALKAKEAEVMAV